MSEQTEYYLLSALRKPLPYPVVSARTGYAPTDVLHWLRSLKENYYVQTDNLTWWITPDGTIRRQQLLEKLGATVLH